MKKPTESDVLSAVLQYLHLRGVYCWRANNHSTYDSKRGCFRKFTGLKGMADILGILPGGRFLAVECKSGTGRVRAEQQEFLAEVTRLGGVAGVVRGVEDAEALLEGCL